MGVIVIGVLIIFFIFRFSTAWEAEKQKEQKKQWEETFRRIAIDGDLEILVNEELNDPRKREEVWGKLQPIFAQIPSCKDIQMFPDPRRRSDVERDMARRILMALKGKVPQSETWNFSGANIYLPSQVTADERLKRKQFKDMMQWVETELQRHGLPVRLIVVVGYQENKDGNIRWKEKEIYWDDYDDPTEYGKLTDNVHGFKWRYEPKEV